MKNNDINVDVEENTFKHYYFPPSDDDTSLSPRYSTKRPNNDSLDEFFEEPKKKRVKLNSSSVGRSTKDGGMSYISTNVDDGATATHLIKIEVYDMKKLATIDPEEHWKHADVRLKYYVNKQNNHHRQTRGLIYNITKEISNSSDCKKYTFKHK
jgi:hypothetical protein